MTRQAAGDTQLDDDETTEEIKDPIKLTSHIIVFEGRVSPNMPGHAFEGSNCSPPSLVFPGKGAWR